MNHLTAKISRRGKRLLATKTARPLIKCLLCMQALILLTKRFCIFVYLVPVQGPSSSSELEGFILTLDPIIWFFFYQCF